MIARRIRHSRSHEFDSALEPAAAQTADGRWTGLADDPNAAPVLARRAETLRAAWRDPIADRTAYLVGECRNMRVLDIGCVAHDVARMRSTNWLHAQIAEASSSCLGVDVVEEGIDAMNALGYDAVLHDLGAGLGPLADQPSFDVIVAGELIEHVGSIDMLFETAKEILTPTGRLLLTTPNPYAPARVNAGQRGVVWENVDHILYAFPSGIAELAERHGLLLAEAFTIDRSKPRVLDRLKRIRDMIRGRRWLSVGYATQGDRQVTRPGKSLAWLRCALPTSARRFVGETFVYVVTRADTE